MRRQLTWMALGAAGTLALLSALWWVPVATRKSVNQDVVVLRIPLGVKLSSFLYRDWMYRHLVREVAGSRAGDVERVHALYDWTVAHIRTDIPAEWVVEDDHPLHVIIRGYGLSWQVADVFTTLCTYAGYPATMAKAWADDRRWLVVALVHLRGAWRVYDPYHRNQWLTADGMPLAREDLVDHPDAIGRAAHQPLVAGVPYAAYFRDIRPIEPQTVLRPYRQMWWPRVWHELRQLTSRVVGGMR